LLLSRSYACRTHTLYLSSHLVHTLSRPHVHAHTHFHLRPQMCALPVRTHKFRHGHRLFSTMLVRAKTSLNWFPNFLAVHTDLSHLNSGFLRQLSHPKSSAALISPFSYLVRSAYDSFKLLIFWNLASADYRIDQAAVHHGARGKPLYCVVACGWRHTSASVGTIYSRAWATLNLHRPSLSAISLSQHGKAPGQRYPFTPDPWAPWDVGSVFPPCSRQTLLVSAL
jgi:hypothetical protein